MEKFKYIKRISDEVREVRDTETGVHYFRIQIGDVYHPYGFTLCPIYEADGRVRVTQTPPAEE